MIRAEPPKLTGQSHGRPISLRDVGGTPDCEADNRRQVVSSDLPSVCDGSASAWLGRSHEKLTGPARPFPEARHAILPKRGGLPVRRAHGAGPPPDRLLRGLPPGGARPPSAGERYTVVFNGAQHIRTVVSKIGKKAFSDFSNCGTEC